jgi:hypothetical protein
MRSSPVTNTRPIKSAIAIVIVAAAFTATSCKREERGFRVQPPDAQRVDLPMATSFHAGPTTEPQHVINGYE